MTTTLTDRVHAVVEAGAYDYDIQDARVVMALKKGVSLHLDTSGNELRYKVLFGRLPMVVEIGMSSAIFSALLIGGFLVEPPSVPARILTSVVFVLNVHFEYQRIRIAKRAARDIVAAVQRRVEPDRRASA